MCIYIVFSKNLRRMFLFFFYQLFSVFLTCNRTDVSFLNKLASKIRKKNCPDFSYALYEATAKSQSSFFFIFGRFSLLVMRLISSFIHETVLFVFLKNVYMLLVFFNCVCYMQISDMIGMSIMNIEVNIISELSERQWSWVVWGCSGPQWGF